MKKIKSFNSATIPPCWKSLKQKILRTIFICSMWQNATDKNCVKFTADKYGWAVDSNQIEPIWFEGDATPLLVDDILINDCDDETDSEVKIDDCDVDDEET